MKSKRQLRVENDRLVAEISYLRGRIEQLERYPAEVVGHVRAMVGDILNPPPPPPLNLAAIGRDEGDGGEDWTDQLAPRTLTPQQFAQYDHELNDMLVIGDNGTGEDG